jgi:2-dehydro-3-deoxygluconokinase
MTSNRAHDEGQPDVSSGNAVEAEMVTLGETMVLFWPAHGGSLELATYYERSCGGAESNFCIALARLGHRPRWISRLGDDAFGRYIRTTLEREGVQVAAAADATAPTAVFFKERVAAGRRRVLYYRRGSAASRLTPDDLRPDHFMGARVLHVTGITPALSASCAAAVEQALALARAAGALVSVDPNVRPQLWPTEQVCRETLRPLVARADIVLLGHEDAEVLYPGLSEDAVIDAVRDGGAATVVLKLGERGAVAVQEGAWARVEAHPVTVVDTVGAGDGFDAGFVAGWLRGFPLPRCLALAARIGAAAVAVAGDWEGYPAAQEVGL